MIFRISIFLFIITAFINPVTSAESKDVVYMTEDYPPENYIENGELKGYAVEILKAMWKRMGVPEQPIQVIPWARGYEIVQSKPNHVLFAMARNAERENLFKWVGPIYNANVKLFSLTNRKIQIKNIGDSKNFTIGVMRNDIGETLLKEGGFQESALTRVRTLKQLMMMLKTGRVDMICTTEASIKNEIIRDNSLIIKYKPVWPVGEIRVYYAFSRSTDDATVARFQKALTAINDERKSIIRRYNLSE